MHFAGYIITYEITKCFYRNSSLNNNWLIIILVNAVIIRYNAFLVSLLRNATLMELDLDKNPYVPDGTIRFTFQQTLQHNTTLMKFWVTDTL